MAVKAIIIPACNYILGESRLVLTSPFGLGNVSEGAAFKLGIDSQQKTYRIKGTHITNLQSDVDDLDNERLKNIEQSLDLQIYILVNPAIFAIKLE